jgi:hypothetical protein
MPKDGNAERMGANMAVIGQVVAREILDSRGKALRWGADGLPTG